jgi:ABC-type multidrug transport system ATPase subunit
MTPLLRAVRLTKRFGTQVVLADIEAEVFAGDCVAVDGAPGSGRTTLLKVLATLLPPTSGALQINGIDAATHLDDTRRKAAFIGAAPVGLPPFDAREYLRFVAAARGGGRVAEPTIAVSLARAGVAGRASVDGLPRRFQRRLALEAALLAGADLVLVDAASGGTDDTDRRCLLEWIGAATSAGRAVVVAADRSMDIRAACTRVVHLHDGRLVADASMRSPAPTPDEVTA